MEEKDNLIQWIYASKNEEELEERYDVWAKSYEADLDKDFGWYGPIRAVESFIRYVEKDARVLDAGAGTGLVGKLLSEAGFTNIVGMDLSLGMLEEARNKGVYTQLDQMTMGETLGYETDSFDAVVTVGVLTVGHAPVDSLDELIRITKPGGHIVYTLRPDLAEEGGYKEKHAQLEAAGLWKLAELGEPTQILPKGEPDVYHQVYVFEILA